MKFDLTKDFLQGISKKLDRQEYDLVKMELSELHNVDIAELIEELDDDHGKILFELFEDEDSAEILIELDDENRESVLEDLSSQEIAEELIENLDSDDAADIIADLSVEKKEEVLSHIEDIDHASDIVDLLSYPENTAGGLMAKELIQVNEKWSVLRCVREMRKQAEEVDKVYTIYVVNDNDVLLGTLSLKKLLLTPEKTYINTVYNEKVISVKANSDDEEVANIQNNIELALFTPLIAAMGGNVGVQSAAIIVQGLASNSLGMDTLSERLLKELGVALLNGLICSAIVMGITFFLGYPSSIYFTVSISIMAVIIFAALFGTFVPLALDKYKIDPALATGPFITTVNDVLGLFIYFMIGKLFLDL